MSAPQRRHRTVLRLPIAGKTSRVETRDMKLTSMTQSLLLALVLAGCSGGGGTSPAPSGNTATTPHIAALVTPGTWVIMGSSSAAGAGATAGNSWASKLHTSQLARGVVVNNIARGGTVTYQGLPSNTKPIANRPLPDDAINIDAALSRSPKLLLVSYPSNDTALGYSVDETISNLQAIQNAARAKGVAVLFLSTQPRQMPPHLLARLPDIDARLQKMAGPCFVSLREGLQNSAGTLHTDFDSGDGVHPNNAGHQLIFSRIESNLASGQCVRVG